MFNSSCTDLLPRISVPTLIVQCKDDNIIPISCLPVSACLKNPNLIMALTHHGSHCVYFQGLLFPEYNKTWYPGACKNFVDYMSEYSEVEDKVGSN